MYDSANQLIRENNQKLGKTWTWTYDNAGNILSKSEYAYTTGELGTPIDTVTYTYGDADWGDLLTGYDGRTVTSDEIGNMLSDGIHNYTWEHGRQLAAMDSWFFEYDADGLRTERYDTQTGMVYEYFYSNGLLRKMDISSPEIYGSFTFRYDNTGKPISFYYNLTDEENAVIYSGEVFYVVNVQGDVIGLISDEMDSIGSYTYDAWGVVRSVEANNSNGYEQLIMNLNPLRYRGYVYDHETGLYYLQSRYYNPEMGRFINADAFVATGQGFIGNNMFAYCLNNPVNMSDISGEFPFYIVKNVETIKDGNSYVTTITYIQYYGRTIQGYLYAASVSVDFHYTISNKGLIKIAEKDSKMIALYHPVIVNALSNEMQHQADMLRSNALSGRTSLGMTFEMYVHSFFDFLRIMPEKTNTIDIGSVDKNSTDYDYNAKWFESPIGALWELIKGIF